MRALAGAVAMTTAAGLMAAGCSSSHGSSGASGGTTTTAGVGAITPGGIGTTIPGQVEIRPEEDKKLALTLVLSQPDFPAGWTFADHPNTTAAAVAGAQRATCLGLADPAKTYTALEAGPDATSGSTLVQSGAVLMTTSATASLELTKLHTSKGKDCEKTASALALQAPGGATVTIADLTLRAGAVPAAVANAAFRLTATGGTGGGAGTVYLDVIEMQHARAVTVLTLRSEGAPFPPATEDDLVTKIATRTGQAVTG